MKADINMGGNEVVGLPATSSAGSASVSKNYTESRYVRKNLDIDMNDNKITTTTPDIDLRTSTSGSEFYATLRSGPTRNVRI